MRRKLFISQRMGGRKFDDVIEQRDRLYKAFIENVEDVELIDSIIMNTDETNPIILLGESIKLLADADIILMANGWENGRGCWVEYKVAEGYNKEIWFNPYLDQFTKKGE